MITKATIQAQPTTLDEIDVANLVAVIKTGDRYKADPAVFTDLQTVIEDADGSVQAQILNAIIRQMETLGIGVVQINQSQTVGTDGVIYDKRLEREALIDYALSVLYTETFSTKAVDPNTVIDMFLGGEYSVGRLPLKYEGYL